MPTQSGCTLCGGNDHARSECSWSGAPGEREAFRAAHPTLDLNEKADAWGRDQFLYSHVEATWRGWQAGAAWQRAQSAPAGAAPDECNDLNHHERYRAGWNACRAAMLAAPPQPAPQQGDEVRRLREALGDARELIGHGDFSTGVCMCGSGVDGHTIGDGHAPTDEGDYYAGQVMERIDAALAASAEGKA